MTINRRFTGDDVHADTGYDDYADTGDDLADTIKIAPPNGEAILFYGRFYPPRRKPFLPLQREATPLPA